MTGPGSTSFYARRDARRVTALGATTGPWDPGLQHGGPPAALLAHTLDTLGRSPGSRLCRISIDFHGPVPVADLDVHAEVLRPGSRIQLASAALSAGGRTAMRATAWYVVAEAGRSPEVPAGFVVPPLPAAESIVQFPGAERFPYAEALEWRFVTGSVAEPGPATAWTRVRIPLVDDEPLTGLERTLIAVDAANGISAVLPFMQWTFVPVDLTLVMTRHALGDWVGMSSNTYLHSDGVGLTETVLFDGQGAFGRALQTLFVAPRKK